MRDYQPLFRAQRNGVDLVQNEKLQGDTKRQHGITDRSEHPVAPTVRYIIIGAVHGKFPSSECPSLKSHP